MRVAQVVGGYSLGGADLLRRAMGKKNVEEMKRQRAVFIKGAAERNVKESVATEIFDLMEKFAGYGFNKSHAAAYSYVAYQTAYLKVHHPAAFMAANLCMVMDDGDKMKNFIDDAKENGVELLMPDVNQSEWFFSVPDESHIRFGLGGIKGLSQSVVTELVKAREEGGPFIDLFDFAARVPSLNAKFLEGLIKAGAFDSLDPDRGKLFGNISQALGAAQSLRASVGQASLFADPGEEQERIVSWIPAPPWSERQKLIEEKNVLGYWLTGHMYDQYREELKHFSSTALSDLQPTRDVAKLAGIITNIRQVQGKRGRMGIVTIDDGTAAIEVFCFSEVWERYRKKLKLDDVVCITGKVRYDDFSKRMSVTMDGCDSLDEIRCRFGSELSIEIQIEKKNHSNLFELRDSIQSFVASEGLPISIWLTSQDIRGRLKLNFFAKDIENLINSVKKLSIVSNIRIQY